MAGPTLKAGAVGLPFNVKEQGKRVDFRPDDFTLAIETKGYRLAWSRVALCPCPPVNDQTNQPDPTCDICHGSGWIFFRPNDLPNDTKIIGPLDSLQLKLLGTDANAIRGIMSGFQNDDRVYDQINKWVEGTVQCSVRPENKLGYHDRIVNLDSTIPYAQLVTAGDPAVPLKLTYLAREINLLRSETTVFVLGTDFNLVDGDIVWILTGTVAAEGERLTVHYHCHPTWRVVNHPHSLRLTPVKSKTKTVGGDPVALPQQAVLRYEFLLSS